MPAQVLHALGHKGSLPGLEGEPFAIHGRFDQGRWSQAVFIGGFVFDLDFNPVGASPHFLHDHPGQRHRLGPQRIKFSLYPIHAFGALVGPNDLVVLLPSRTGFIHGAHEPDPATIPQFNHSSFAVDEATEIIGGNANSAGMAA